MAAMVSEMLPEKEWHPYPGMRRPPKGASWEEWCRIEQENRKYLRVCDCCKQTIYPPDIPVWVAFDEPDPDTGEEREYRFGPYCPDCYEKWGVHHKHRS